MPEPTAPPVQASKVRTGMRTLSWFLPGLCSPVFLIFLFMRSYGGSSSPLGDYAILGGFVVLTLGCAFFNTILDLAPPQEMDQARNKRIGKSIFLFIFLQIFIVPVLGMGTMFGCTAVMGIAS